MGLTVFLVVLVFLAFAGLGIFLIYTGFTVGKKPVGSTISWPETGGKVISSEVIETSESTVGGGLKSQFKPVVRFQYFINGAVYHSIQIGPGVGAESIATARQMVALYPVGKNVKVHYNPQNFNEAVLPSHIPAARPVVIAGIILLALSLLVACGGVSAFLYYFFTH